MKTKKQVRRDDAPKRKIPTQRHKGVKWGEGKVNIGPYSSLRKLMRAARRDKLPEERIGLIERAMESASKRQHLYE